LYNHAVRKKFFIAAAAVGMIAAASLAAQAPPGDAGSQPKVRVNYLNVCSPGEEDSRQIASALERIPGQPKFAEDFEVARGRSTLSSADLKMQGAAALAGEPSTSEWIRIRREFPEGQSFVNAQYSFSINGRQVVETLTWRSRDTTEMMQLSISASSTGATSPAQVARVNTPAERIRIERFGRPSIVLARCQGADQSRFEPIFKSASDLLAHYRGALRVGTLVPAEIMRLPKPAPPVKSGKDGRPPRAPAR
jgi:hypothetical protein